MSPPISAACTYRFFDELKPRSTCGLATLGSRGLCVWHDPGSRPKGFDVRRALQEVVEKPDHWLEGAILAGEDLRGTTLFRAQLSMCDLQLANLSNAFLAEARLNQANLRGAKLQKTNLSCAAMIGAKCDNADARNAIIEDADLDGASLQGTKFDGAYIFGATFSAKTLSYSTDWGLPGEFQHGRFDRAAQVFRLLGSHFRDVSYHHKSVDFYYKEMTALHLAAIGCVLPPTRGLALLRSWCPRIQHPSFWLAWLGWSFHRWLWGYGVRPLRPLSWMVGVILLFGFLIFPTTGVTSADRANSSHDHFVGLSLSMVTFATLGYGNRTPTGTLGEFLGGAEALIGALLMSVFLVSLATRYVHRA